jgi:C1A family cysteine protease
MIFVTTAFLACNWAYAQSVTAPTPASGPSKETEQLIVNLKKRAQSEGWSFIPQATEVSEKALANLTGELPPTTAQLANAAAISQAAERVVKAYRDTLDKSGTKETAPPACNPEAASWDWRTYKKVTKPKLQQCGDCWAFASTGQIESAFLMAGWSEDDLSEQRLLDCSQGGDCSGGRRLETLTWAVGTAESKEVEYPKSSPGYKGSKGSCDVSVVGNYRLLAAAWIDASGNVPQAGIIKKALCEYGPISASINATAAMQSYGGPDSAVFSEPTSSLETNHAILIIGWDNAKDAWLIKNSWGPKWGFDGFAWVKFGSNNVGRWPVWAKAPAPGTTMSLSLKSEMDKLQSIVSAPKQ